MDLKLIFDHQQKLFISRDPIYGHYHNPQNQTFKKNQIIFFEMDSHSVIRISICIWLAKRILSLSIIDGLSTIAIEYYIMFGFGSLFCTGSHMNSIFGMVIACRNCWAQACRTCWNTIICFIRNLFLRAKTVNFSDSTQY